MDDRYLLERVVKMEAELRYLTQTQENRDALHKETADTVDEVDAKLTKVLLELERNKGFVGGIVFITGAIWLFIKSGLPYLLNRRFDKWLVI